MAKKRAPPRPTARRNPPRKCKRLPAVPAIRKGHPQRSFLDTVPEEVVENIVRLCSRKPEQGNWADFLDSRTAEHLLTLGGAPGRVVRRRVTRVHASDRPLDAPHGLLLLCGGAHARHHFRRLLRLVDPGLAALHVTRASFPPTMARALAGACTGLRSLSLTMRPRGARFPLAAILAAVGARLDALALAWPECAAADAKAVAAHCTALQALSLTFARVAAPLDEVWRTTGGTLASLRVLAPDGAAAYSPRDFARIAVQALLRHAAALQALAFECAPPAHAPEIASLAVARGKHLQDLELNWCRFPTPLLRDIARKCPRVRVALREACGPKSDAIAALGPRMRLINVGCETPAEGPERPGKSLAMVSAACPNIETLVTWCDNVSAPAFASLFEHPKPLLREINVKHVRDDRSAQLLAVIARHAQALEVFTLSAGLPGMKALRVLVEGCRRLRKVVLKDVQNVGWCRCALEKWCGPAERRPEFSHKVNLGTAVEVFAQGGAVRLISVACAFAGENAAARMVDVFRENCLVARRKKISVTICGMQYV